MPGATPVAVVPAPGLPAHVSGERVLMALMEARPAGLHTGRLMTQTGLSRSQVRRGITYLRDTAADMSLSPLIWDSREGYWFSENPADWALYEYRQFTNYLQAIRRFMSGCVQPHAELQPEDLWVRHILKQLDAAESAFELLVDEYKRRNQPRTRSKSKTSRSTSV